MPTNRVEYPINSGYIQVVAEGHILPAFWAHPDTGGTFPGVVLVHSHWGLTASVRQWVRHLAEAGHYVIAPDLFDRQLPETLAAARQQAQALATTGPPYVAAAVSALATHNHCNGDLAVLGYGMGGTLSLHLAVHREDLKAAVFVNGDITHYRVLLATSSTPLLALYGAEAAFSTQDVLDDLAQQIKTTSPDNQLIVYNDVGNDFFDASQAGFVPAAAEDAWQRVLNFLAAHLTGPSHPADIRSRTY